MKAKIGVLFLALIVGMAGMVAPAMAATEDEIQASIVNGTAWLAANQNLDGSWGSSNFVAETGLVLYKLIDRAIELGKDPLEVCGPVPSATCYEYAQNVKDGLNFTMTNVETKSITPQDHTAGATGTIDDPDTNGNGIGLAWQSQIGWDRKSYTTGIITGALSLLDGTETVAVGSYEGKAYSAIVQDAVDWLSYAQSDLGNTQGAWEYDGRNNGSGGDNSVSGYAVLGLAEAQAAGYTVPGWVKTELNAWIDYIQTDVDAPGCDFGGGSDCTGGSGYTQPGYWVNILKTGNLIEEMTLYGDSKTAPRVVNATDYITRHFFDPNIEPGWGYSRNPASYQAMFTTMKGLEFANITLLDMDNDGTPEFDWWLNFTDVIVAQEIPSGPGQGYWDRCDWGDKYLCTAWALLTLEKTAPQQQGKPGKVVGYGLLGNRAKPEMFFNIWAKDTDPSPGAVGTVEVTDYVKGLKIKSTKIDSVVTILGTPKKGTIKGVAQVTGGPSPGTYDFQIDIVDAADPGKGADEFKITLVGYPGGYTNSGKLSQGDITVVF